LLTTIEAGTVFAELPGFRDPRYAAPDDCYDLTAAIRLTSHLDELMVGDTGVTLGGWAALDILTAGEHERVSVVLTASDRETRFEGRRVRRVDLVSGRGEALTRRAWAGFAVVVDLAAAAGLSAGEWALWIELDHAGVVVRQPIGRHVSALATAAARAEITAGSTRIRWDTSEKQWALVVR
jgi:hypothetical protein